MNNPDWMFRTLESDEEATFRKWAREHWEPKEPETCWHPVVRDEWNRITKERSNERQNTG